jgi:hypothetical protein
LRLSVAAASIARNTAYARLAGAGISSTSRVCRMGCIPLRKARPIAASAQMIATIQRIVPKTRGTNRRQPLEAADVTAGAACSTFGVIVAVT